MLLSSSPRQPRSSALVQGACQIKTNKTCIGSRSWASLQVGDRFLQLSCLLSCSRLLLSKDTSLFGWLGQRAGPHHPQNALPEAAHMQCTAPQVCGKQHPSLRLTTHCCLPPAASGYSEEQLRSLFQLCGSVAESRIVHDKQSGRPVG